jgi:hypothetical protein
MMNVKSVGIARVGRETAVRHEWRMIFNVGRFKKVRTASMRFAVREVRSL